jgi:hypothetical protein
VEFVSGRILYIILRGRWCNIIVLNVHAPGKDKCDDVKDSSSEELGRVFDQFPRYDVKILSGDFSAKGSKKYTFKPTVGNWSLHENSFDSGVRVVKYVTSET